jgi:hypothetical protein
MLYHKECRVVLELLLRPEQLEIIVSEQERQSLIHLKQSQILSDTLK